MLEDHSSILAACVFGGFAFFATCTAVSKSTLTVLESERRPFAAACITAFFNASFVSPLSIYAAWQLISETATSSELECVAGKPNLITSQPSVHGIVAVGLTCGYFMADTMMLIRDPVQMKKDLGGSTQYAIMWVHHVISMIVWPYSMLEGKAAYFVLYYMVTEITNVGQNAYLLLREFKSSLEMTVGILWIASFFIVRVLPVPWLVYVYARMFWLGGAACGLTTPELVVGRLTVPIPLCLNIFWFNLMVKKVQRMLKKSGGGQKKA